MKFKLSARGSLFTVNTHEEIARTCALAGFDGVEGDPVMFENERGFDFEGVKKSCGRHGIKMAAFHLPSGPADYIACFYESVRTAAVKKIRRWMENAAAAGALTGILHPTTSRLDAETEGVGNYLRQLGKSLREILPAAGSLSLDIAVENMLLVPGIPSRFGAFAAHIRLIREEFAHDSLGFCYDSGHALIAGREEAEKILEEMSPRLRAFHLQDNAGDRDSHLAPGRGLVDWGLVFGEIRESGFGGYATVEAPPFAPGPDYSPEAWETLCRETVELARKHGARRGARTG